VHRAEAYLRTHMDSPIPLSRLCLVTGLSERALRNAFYRVHGVSPTRWMLRQRLAAVRRALVGSGERPVTVTGIATDHGFFELGRFAAWYRGQFGETPSETLRSAARTTVLRPNGERSCWHD
jgi:transcriptional regulator GlxA family with amidase domain